MDDRLSGDDRAESALRRAGARTDPLLTPPPSVWAGIQTELAPAQLRSLRLRPPLVLAAAATLVVAIVVGVGVIVAGDGGSTELARADLVHDDGFDPLGATASARATLVDDGGARTVRLDAVDLPDPGSEGDLEVWLIGIRGDEIDTIQTLGRMTGPDATGAFGVPASFDTDGYDQVAVDISVEPRDGDPTHSGRSLVRGELTTL